MTERPDRPIPQASTRQLFGELVSQASCELGSRPSLLASGYLVDLLEARVRTRRSTRLPDAPGDTLAESLLEALQTEGSARIARLRALGDRALFDAGFFGDSLRGKTVGVSYYADVGTTAYSRLSLGTGSELFHELACGFLEFVELLAEVGERARGSRSGDLLRIYDRYQDTRSPRDRARLMRRGLIVPDRGASERPQ